ncbi:MAG: hypothetical protein M3065_01585 [Actinomycetota bacterium]|nr:hypothetical protein [Actinomycetota bacterium]
MSVASCAGDHGAAPVGFVDVSAFPFTSVATHSRTVGHESAANAWCEYTDVAKSTRTGFDQYEAAFAPPGTASSIATTTTTNTSDRARAPNPHVFERSTIQPPRHDPEQLPR